ncbi:MAG: DUF4215 domain-containing protein [Deltaproteobacteria bacterium]|nr:DUF4215 domain-containing protein [Deltaproteobacteria bacterium]
MKRFAGFFLCAALVTAWAGLASAQVQDKDQQTCLNKVIKTARKVGDAVLKDASWCVRRAAKNALPDGVTAQQCLVGDIKNRVQKAKDKLGLIATAACTTAPDFGFVDAATTSDAYVTDNLGLSTDAFGADLDATLAASDGVDPVGRCSATISLAHRKLEGAMHKELEGCVKTGLKSQSITGAAGMQACLDAISADTRGRVAKATGLVETLLTAKCPTGDLDTMFPGLTSICGVYAQGTDAAGLAGCSNDRLRCRICRIFDFGYVLDRDCDLFDDAAANGSCPDCGNTVVDSGEQCDDGNNISGDGCTAGCLDEFCGDGVINDNGAEQCDDGAGNSDVLPDACRTNCQNPICGDGVTDLGEECDDANTNEADGCTSQCTSCGNGITGGLEQCDDGNTAAGDCCGPACTFETYGSACTGPPSGQCTAPGCNGAGACAELPANENGACDDGDECSNGSECQSGICTATAYVVTGAACRWLGVGNPGTDANKQVSISNNATSDGPWCGNFTFFGQNSVTNADIVSVRGDNTTPGTEFNSFANVDGGDVVTNNARVIGTAGVDLPGMGAGISEVAAGQVVSKSPPPTKYDTTGTDPRVADCQSAQASISTSTAVLLDALPATQDLGGTLTSLPASGSATVNAVNVGGLNVFDMTNITGGNYVTLNLDGGGNPNTVFIMRISSTLNTAIGWVWNLQNGLTADHLLLYSKGTGNAKCELGESNTGGGTLFCPNGRVAVRLNSIWSGSLLGGGNTSLVIDVGTGVQLTHQRFTGF